MLYVILSVIATLTSVSYQESPVANAATFDAKTFVAKSSPNTVHEGNPHGVPSYYSWYNNAQLYALNAPRPETTHVNFWGEVYTDSTNVHPSNTRVALKNCQFWGLINGTWTQLQNTTIDGGAWTEDYSSYVTTMDLRSESDGSQSVVPRNGQNAHFWADTGFWNATGVTFQGTIASCHARLILADSNGVDDRDSARYLLSMGADWRQPDGSCPFVFGSYICDGMAHGRYIRVSKEWRTAVMTTMSNSDLNTYAAPPSSLFLQPDGSYPDMLPEITSFSANTTTASSGAAVTLSWSTKGAGDISINQGVGDVSGVSKVVNPTATTTYTMTASNMQGSVQSAVTITVPGSTPVPNASNSNGGSNDTSSENPNSDTVVPVDLNGDGMIDRDEQKAAEDKSASTATANEVEFPEIQSNIRVSEPRTKMSAVEIAGIAAGSGMILIAGAMLTWWLRYRRSRFGRDF